MKRAFILLSFIGLILTSCNIGGKEYDTYKPPKVNNSAYSAEKPDEPQETLESKYINSSCDQIIDKVYFKICYSYSYKAAKSVVYKLEGDLVNELNIKERPKFYAEEALPQEYRAQYYDYTGSGYDRGHLAPDAAFDWSKESLEATYSLANIIPQDETVNREQWEKAEEHARKEAVILGEIEVANVVIYPDNPKYIGEDKIAVPKGFYKILSNPAKNYLECFYYENNASKNGKTLYSNKTECPLGIKNSF